MARLLHEVWLGPESFPGCVLAGPRGENARRRIFGPGSRLIHMFEAGSHLEAMRYYHNYLKCGPFATLHPDLDGQDYPDEWLEEQRALRRLT